MNNELTLPALARPLYGAGSAQVTVIAGPDAGLVVQLVAGTPLTIGSSSDNDLVLRLLPCRRYQ